MQNSLYIKPFALFYIVFFCLSVHAQAEINETPVQLIPLAAPLDQADSEISGLTWCGDKLILLPQYPERFADDGNSYFYYLERQQILNFLDGKTTAALSSQRIKVNEKDLRKAVSIFDGFEGITCEENSVWLSIEAISFLGKYQSFVVPAEITFGEQATIEIDQTKLVFLESLSGMRNMGDEAILNSGTGVIALHEVNDERAVDSAVARHINNNDGTKSELAFPHIPFRITDATALGDNNRFWVMNYKYSGDKFSRGAKDSLTEKFGEGESHQRYCNVERLVEMQLNEKTISLTEKAPILLKMLDVEGRNWEGLVRLEGRGFLLATDKHPETLLGFVPYKNSTLQK